MFLMLIEVQNNFKSELKKKENSKLHANEDQWTYHIISAKSLWQFWLKHSLRKIACQIESSGLNRCEFVFCFSLMTSIIDFPGSKKYPI